MKKPVPYAFLSSRPSARLARVSWLSAWFSVWLSGVSAPTLCNVSRFGNAGILSLLSLLPLTVGLNQFHGVAIAAEGRQWEYDPYTHQLQITSQQKPQYFILADPVRIVIDVPNSNFGINPTEENYPGLVRKIRISQFKPGETRIVMDLDPGISIHPGQITLEPLGQGNRWVLRPQIALSQALPPMENRGTLPQLPAIANIGHQPPILGSQPESAIVPVSSDVGLPTQQVTPGINSSTNPDGDVVTVRVPGLNEVPTSELNSEPTGTTDIFVPPPPPPDWENQNNQNQNNQNQNNQNQNNQNQNLTDRSSTIPPSASQTPSVNDVGAIPESPLLTPSEKELMESLPPYSEWQQVPLSENPSPAPAEFSATEADGTDAETAGVLSVPAVPEWETATAAQKPGFFGQPLDPDSNLNRNPVSQVFGQPLAPQPNLNRNPVSQDADGTIAFGEPLPVRNPQKPGFFGQPLDPDSNLNRNPVSQDSDGNATAPQQPGFFGQPVDPQPNLNRNPVSQDSVTDPNVLVAAGTVMILRYPGSEGFTLKSGSSRREVLVVDVEVYDRNGKAIAPVGTPAIGTFISDRSGSRFVVEEIVINGEMVPISAASDAIAGDMAVSRNGLLSWSTLGAVGGAAIGGLAGGPLLGGAAAGLAANLLSAPKQTAIAPGQVLPVRFTEHWRSNQP
jgi:AMIN domain